MILSQYFHIHPEISSQARYCGFKDPQAGDIYLKFSFTM